VWVEIMKDIGGGQWKKWFDRFGKRTPSMPIGIFSGLEPVDIVH
jgi:hypothetical protein